MFVVASTIYHAHNVKPPDVNAALQSSGYIVSHSYYGSRKYVKDIDKTLRLTGVDSNTLTVQLVAFSLHARRNATGYCYDFLSVDVIGEWCGNLWPQCITITNTSNVVEFKLHTSHVNEDDGFIISYQGMYY